MKTAAHTAEGELNLLSFLKRAFDPGREVFGVVIQAEEYLTFSLP